MEATANVKTLENLSGERIRLRPHSPSPMQLDGDPIGDVVEVDFSIRQRAIKILL
jgi:diacylglycerol kinase family enzyme